jgi:hypothetical protein
MPKLMDAHRRCADKGRDVRRDPLLHQEIQVLAERRPADVEFDVALLRFFDDLHGVG